MLCQADARELAVCNKARLGSCFIRRLSCIKYTRATPEDYRLKLANNRHPRDTVYCPRPTYV